MENTTVEKFDPSRLMEGVKDRIKATFVSMMPEDAWVQMVEKAKDDFFSEDVDRYSNYKKPSQFSLLVQQEFKAELSKKIKEFFATPEWQNTWDGKGKSVLAEEIKKIVVENSGAILLNMIGEPMAYAIQNMKASLLNNLTR